METRVGPVSTSYSARGIPSYSVELWHDGLRKHRLIRGSDRGVVCRKASVQQVEWNDKWVAHQEREAERRRKEAERQSKDELKEQREARRRLAAEQTSDAKRELERLEQILAHTLAINDVIDWESLKDKSPFPEPKPPKPVLLPEPLPYTSPPEPRRTSAAYQPRLGLLDKLLSSRRQRIASECAARYRADHKRWQQEVKRLETKYLRARQEHRHCVQQQKEKFQRELSAWKERGAAFLLRQKESNDAVDERRSAYERGDAAAVAEYCDMVLANSAYPDCFPQEFELDYRPRTKVLVVDYSLPSPDRISVVREVKYVPSRDELVPQLLTTAQAEQLYDSVLYQVALRTVHELFESDVIGCIDTIVFNGWVRSMNLGVGKEVNACVLSLQTRRQEFLAINLANVDSKICFKALKGVGSSKLHSLVPVAPIVQVERNDRRFVPSRDVAQSLDESSNLATMDWEDFEHLIRELFAKEFAIGGGEVNVTQASRDGGVDAIAFDPDPIRGGKTVIQAKRYTNTVGVSAVRDLYGTVMNEGANKGILVTTSDYGPDAYAFVRGKPLTLISGANLLHLLEKHGHKARIDLGQARKQLASHR